MSGEMFVPDAFFTTRKGLVVHDSFQKLVLSDASPVKLTPMAILTSFDITESEAEDVRRAEVAGGDIFKNTSIFCLQFAEMLIHQWSGGKGVLVVDGKANRSYVRGIDNWIFSSHVTRLVSEQEWHVSASQLCETGTAKGDRVFSSKLRERQSAETPPAQRSLGDTGATRH